MGRPSLNSLVVLSGQSPPCVGSEKGMGPGAGTNLKLWPGVVMGVDEMRLKR